MSNLGLALTLKVVDEASAEMKAVGKEFDKLKASSERLGFAIGTSLRVAAVAATAAIVGSTLAAINNADAMGDAAARAGTSTEAFSALAYAAELSGTTSQALETGLRGLNKSLAESEKEGGAAAEAFKYLGVETKNADGTFRKVDEVFKDVAESISKMPDGVNKTSAAAALLGKSAGPELVGLLNNGRQGLTEFTDEAERMGLVISQTTADAAGEFNDTIARLGNAMLGAGTTIATVLLPTLNMLGAELIASTTKGEGFKSFVGGLGQVFRAAIKIIGTAITTLRAFGMGIGAVGAAIAAAASGDFKGALTIFKLYKKDVDALNVSNEEFKKKVDATGVAVEAGSTAVTGLRTRTTSLTEATRRNTDAANAAKRAQEELNRERDRSIQAGDDYLNQIQQEIAGMREVTTEEAAQITLQQSKYKFVSDERKKQIAAQARELDGVRQLQREYNALADVQMKSAQRNFEYQKRGEISQKFYNDLVGTGTTNMRLYAEANKMRLEELNALTGELAQLEGQLAVAQGRPAAVRNTQEIADLQAKVDATGQYIERLNAQAAGMVTNNMQLIRQGNEMQRFISLIQSQRDEVDTYTKSMAEMELLYKQGAITIDEYRAALRKIGPGFTELEQFAYKAAEAMESSFSDFFFDIMQGNFTDMVGNFKRAIDRMVADALAAKLAESLFGIGGRQGATGILASAGNFLSGMFREKGGPVTAGQPYIVGERRAEVFVPTVSGKILPDTDSLAGMQGGTNINFHVTTMDAKSMMQNMDSIKRELTQMVIGTTRTYNMRAA